jgi:hypothetical protein
MVREGSEWAAHGEQKAAAELELAGAMEDEAWVREDEIGRAVEHQWVTVVLWEHWIGAELWQNQPELYRLKHVSPLQRAPTYFKRYNPWSVG